MLGGLDDLAKVLKKPRPARRPPVRRPSVKARGQQVPGETLVFDEPVPVQCLTAGYAAAAGYGGFPVGPGFDCQNAGYEGPTGSAGIPGAPVGQDFCYRKGYRIVSFDPVTNCVKMQKIEVPKPPKPPKPVKVKPPKPEPVSKPERPPKPEEPSIQCSPGYKPVVDLKGKRKCVPIDPQPPAPEKESDTVKWMRIGKVLFQLYLTLNSPRYQGLKGENFKRERALAARLRGEIKNWARSNASTLLELKELIESSENSPKSDNPFDKLVESDKPALRDRVGTGLIRIAVNGEVIKPRYLEVGEIDVSDEAEEEWQRLNWLGTIRWRESLGELVSIVVGDMADESKAIQFIKIWYGPKQPVAEARLNGLTGLSELSGFEVPNWVLWGGAGVLAAYWLLKRRR